MRVTNRMRVGDAWQWLYQQPTHDPEWLNPALERWPDVGGVEFRQTGMRGGPICAVKTALGVVYIEPGDWLIYHGPLEIEPVPAARFARDYLAVDAPLAEHRGRAHDPENGVWGECFRSCIAALLRPVTLEDVPHIFDNGRDAAAAYGLLDSWLAERGLAYFQLPVMCEHPADVLEFVGRYYYTGQHWILGGKSARGIGHMVVCEGASIVFDPSGAGIASPIDEETSSYFIGIIALRV